MAAATTSIAFLAPASVVLKGKATDASPRKSLTSSFSGATFSMTTPARQHVDSKKHARISASVVTVTEPVTGIAFPSTLLTPGASSDLTIAGAGFREKAFGPLKFKVYGVALYVDPASLTSLAAWKGKGPGDLQKDEAFYKAVAESSSQKALLIVLNRDVSGDQFVGALSEELKPRLQALGGGQEVQAEFEAVIKAQDLKKGTAIFLTWTLPSSLQVSIIPGFSPPPPTAAQSVFDSAPLLSGLFDIFLGPRSVSPSLRENVAATLASKL